MTGAAELARAVEEALAFVTGQPGVLEAEVFAAANDALLTRLNYTSHIPSNGVEEPKSVASRGLGLQVVFAGPGGGASIGFGSEAADLTVRGAERALAKARQAAVVDPEFVSLPRPSPRQARTLTIYHDQRLMALHLSLAGFFFELSEVLDSGAFDSPVFPSAGLESASFVPGFSPARL